MLNVALMSRSSLQHSRAVLQLTKPSAKPRFGSGSSQGCPVLSERLRNPHTAETPPDSSDEGEAADDAGCRSPVKKAKTAKKAERELSPASKKAADEFCAQEERQDEK
jgi:hypothetical protein